jgi:hypothetical protein
LSVAYPCFFVLIVPFVLTVQHNTNIHAPGGIRTRNPSKRATIWLRLKRLGNWNRQKIFFIYPFRLTTSPVLVYLGLYCHQFVIYLGNQLASYSDTCYLYVSI